MSKKLEIKILTQLQDKLSAPLKRLQSTSKSTESAFRALQTRLKDLNIQSRNINSFKKIEQDLDLTSNKLTIAKSKFEALNKQVMSTVNPSKAMVAELNLARQSVERLIQKQKEQSTKLNETKSKLDAAGISTKNLAMHETDLANKIKSANTELKQHQDELRKASEVQDQLSNAKNKMASTQQLASNMAITGTAGYMTGQKVLGSMTNIMMPGVEFESSMSKVQAMARLDKDSKELAELRQQARDLGASTMYSATEAADAQGFLAIAGFTPQAIKDAMPGMLDVAKAGGIDLARAADISSNILSGLKLDASEMGRVGDVLTGTFTRANTNLELLGETMKYAAPMAASLGVDIETLSAATGKLGEAGIKGSMAGTALRSILNRLSAPPKAAEKALNALNITTTDAKGNLRDFTDILAELNKKTAKMGDAQRAGYLKAIAGEEAVSSLNVLVDKAGTGELQQLVAELKQASGEASKVAKTMADNIVGDLDELSSAWEDIGISIFDGQNGILRGLVQNLTSVVNTIGQWIKENPELTATIVKIVAVIAAVVAGMGALAIAIASVLGPFAILRYALSFMSITGAGGIGIFGRLASALGIVKTAIIAMGRALLMNPIGLAITTIAGLTYLIYDNWSTVSEWFSDMWTTIKSYFSDAINVIANIFWNWTPLGIIIQNFDAIKTWFTDLWRTITGFFTSGVSDTNQILQDWDPLSILSNIFAGAGAIISTAFNGVSSAVSTSIQAVSSTISNGIDTAKTFAAEKWQTVSETASGLWQDIKGFFNNGTDKVDSEIQTWNVAQSFQSIWGKVGSFFTEKTTEMSTSGTQLVSGLVSGMQSQAEVALEAARKLANAIATSFKEAMQIRSPSRVFKALGAFIPQGAAVGITQAQDLAINAARTMAVSVMAAGTMTPVMAEPIQFDHRPVLNTTVPSKQTAPVAVAGDTINIHIHTSQGQNTQDIAHMVKQEIERLQAQKQSRLRASYTDYGY